MKNIFDSIRHSLLPAIVISIIFITGCQPIPVDIQQGKVYLPDYKRDELVVWRKSGVSDATWNSKKANFQLVYAGTLNIESCKDCNDSLERWSGTAIRNFINTEVVDPRTSPRGRPMGEDDDFYYSLNLIVGLPIETKMPQFVPSAVTPFHSNAPVITVAVFDTGVEPEITSTYTSSVPTCKIGGDRGWNFVNDDSNTSDIFPTKHGTVVSKFIIDQLPLNPGGNRINILPVKIFGDDGSSDLFHVLCGFSYAKNAGAKIINASFGFYYYANDGCPLLRKYVEEKLTANNILLVASAGNVIPTEDAMVRSSSLGIPDAELRNLDVHYFYPGGLAKDLPNVFCVTTASDVLTPSTSPNQNYSPYVVDIGTLANVPDSYSFMYPFGGPGTVTGSSFAAPVFTGKLASWYSAVGGASGNKETIIPNLKIKNVVREDMRRYGGRVKLGQYVH